jgi:hypothetical protein
MQISVKIMYEQNKLCHFGASAYVEHDILVQE